MKTTKKKEANDIAIKDIRNMFRLKKEKKLIKDIILRDARNLFEHRNIRNIFKLKKNNKAIKDRIIRDIRNLFEKEEEENYYKPVRVFGVITILNTKVKTIEIKDYQLKNILIKLNHT